MLFVFVHLLLNTLGLRSDALTFICLTEVYGIWVINLFTDL